MLDEAPRPTTPLDDIYAQLLREQPDNEVLWDRIVERAKAVPPQARPEGETVMMTYEETQVVLAARAIVYAYYREEEPGVYTYAAIQRLMTYLRALNPDALDETIRLAQAQIDIDQEMIRMETSR